MLDITRKNGVLNLKNSGGGITLNGETPITLENIYKLIPTGKEIVLFTNDNPAELYGGDWVLRETIELPKAKTYPTVIHNAQYPYPEYLVAYTNANIPNESGGNSITVYNNWGGGYFGKFLVSGNTIKNLNLGVNLSSDVTTLYVWKRVG